MVAICCEYFIRVERQRIKLDADDGSRDEYLQDVSVRLMIIQNTHTPIPKRKDWVGEVSGWVGGRGVVVEFAVRQARPANSDECEKHPVVKAVNNLVKSIKHPLLVYSESSWSG